MTAIHFVIFTDPDSDPDQKVTSFKKRVKRMFKRGKKDVPIEDPKEDILWHISTGKRMVNWEKRRIENLIIEKSFSPSDPVQPAAGGPVVADAPLHPQVGNRYFFILILLLSIFLCGLVVPNPVQSEGGGPAVPDPVQTAAAGPAVPDPVQTEGGGLVVTNPVQSEGGGLVVTNPVQTAAGGPAVPDLVQSTAGGSAVPDPVQTAACDPAVTDPVQTAASDPAVPNHVQTAAGGPTAPDPVQTAGAPNQEEICSEWVFLGIFVRVCRKP